MKGFLSIIIVCFTSLYFFPVQFTYLLPGINTKLILASFGAFFILYDLARYGRGLFDRNLFVLIIYALIVSACGYASVIFNNTQDYAYATYIGSMLVWFSGAYFIVRLIKSVHGYVDVRLVANYLIAVCVLQCLAAVLNDRFPVFKRYVDTYIQQGQDFINSLSGSKRKYGIGANLDTAGVRFSIVLILIPAVLANLSDRLKEKWFWMYLASFLFIIIEGNIIARTTIVGTVFACLYIVLNYKSFKTENRTYNRRISYSVAVVAVIGCLVTAYLFHTNESFEKDMRFGFEGFFSLIEKGEWKVSSNDRLETMYVFPDNLKTWLVGDGYFSNPINTDPYFIGKVTGGYYMGTDVGFLRFIFYFGLIGLGAFAAFFVKCGQICGREYPEYKKAFYMLVVLGFVIWLKVSTDIFLVFALFIAAHMISTLGTPITRQRELCG